MIALGTVALLQHRDVFERLGQTDDQSVIANMVEELMRYLTIVPARWIGWRSKTSTSVVNRSMHRTKSRASRNADRVRHAGPAPA
jgi:hypothetical protein